MNDLSEHVGGPPPRLLRLAQVEEIVQMGRSNIYRRMAAGTFPKPVRLGETVVRWKQADIEKWIESLSTEMPKKAEGAI